MRLPRRLKWVDDGGAESDRRSGCRIGDVLLIKEDTCELIVMRIEEENGESRGCSQSTSRHSRCASRCLGVGATFWTGSCPVAEDVFLLACEECFLVFGGGKE